MNIFIPYKDDLFRSAECLDDLRLSHQIEECKIIYEAINATEARTTGLRHPIIKHYYNYPMFVIQFGYICCLEYRYRMSESHALHGYFFEKRTSFLSFADSKFARANFIPLYCQGAKGSENFIRATKETDALFQKRLCEKWDADTAKGRTPKWTRRGAPSFYESRIPANRITG